MMLVWDPAALKAVLGLFCVFQLNKAMVLYDVSSQDFPGGPVVKNSPCNTEDVGSIAGWEIKIPHAMEQPTPQTLWYSCTATTESARHN